MFSSVVAEQAHLFDIQNLEQQQQQQQLSPRVLEMLYVWPTGLGSECETGEAASFW